MGIISRFTDIMGANINALLSRSEDANADKLLEKYIEDTRTSLGQIKAETAAVIADEMACARKLSENADLHKKYEGYAAAAVQSGNDDDARKFLAYNLELDTQRVDLSGQYSRAKENSEKMHQMTTKLADDLQAAEAKLKELQQKLNVAKQQEKLNKISERLDTSPLGKADSLFDAVQKRIDTADAAASLHKEMTAKSDDIADLAKKYEPSAVPQGANSVEDQLAKLKASLN